jgi:uncharacterized repeat protein (TIGR02543 family)
MKRFHIPIVILLISGVLFLNVSTVRALPPLPSSFYGTVKLGGANVPAGTTVYAFINGVQYASSPYYVYNGDTVYSLNVPGDDLTTPDIIEGGVSGDTVVFYIGSTKANQTAPWVASTNVNLDLTATPGITLNVNKTGSGSGTVSSSPAGIDCGSICSADFPKNTSVSLTATAATGSTFTGWSGACSGNAACTLVMDDAKSVTASFTLNTYLLTVSKTGTGSGTVSSMPPGIDCGSTCSASFNYNTSVTLTATAATGSTFTGWSGGVCSGSLSTCQVSMTDARSVTATFTLNTYLLTVSKTGTGSGTVSSMPAGIDCGSTCSASFNYNTSVTLTATAATGSTFTGWSGGVCSGSLSTCTVSMTLARSVTASFVLSQYSLTTSVVGNGSITRDNVGPYYFGDVIQLTAVPDPGWSFSGWSGDLSGSLNPISITINGNKSVTATFTQNTYTLTTSVVGNGSITRDNPGPYHYGDVVQLTAVPDPGWSFSGWSGDLGGSLNPAIITIDANKTVTATFTPITFTLTIIKTGNGSGTVSSIPAGIDCGTTCSYNFTENSVVSLAASPLSSSIFGGWSGAGCSGKNACTLTMDMAKTVTATFITPQNFFLPLILIH